MRKRAWLLVGLGSFWACEPAPQGEIELKTTVVRRRAPSLTAAVLDTLPAGLAVARLQEAGEWLYVCYRGVRGWVALGEAAPSDFLPGDPTEFSLLLNSGDSVVSEVEPNGEGSRYLKLGDLSPWFVPDSLLYAGFYEGLPGEDLGLIIVNFVPRLALLVKRVQLNPETMDMREEQLPLGPEIERRENVLFLTEEEGPFRRAEFVRRGEKRGLLVQLPSGEYTLLWRRAL